MVTSLSHYLQNKVQNRGEKFTAESNYYWDDKMAMSLTTSVPLRVADTRQSSISEVLLLGWMVWQPMCMQSHCSREVRGVEEVIIVRTAARYLSISPCSSISSATSSHLQWCEEACHHHTSSMPPKFCFLPVTCKWRRLYHTENPNVIFCYREHCVVAIKQYKLYRRNHDLKKGISFWPNSKNRVNHHIAKRCETH